MMKKLHIKNVEDLTKENIDKFIDGLNEIDVRFSLKERLQEDYNKTSFNSLDECMKHFDAIPFDDFDEQLKLDTERD